MLPEWFWIVSLFIGAAIGSFLNVVIYRLPRGLSLANPPRSFCPKCKHSLGGADLVPLFSWLFSGGKCRHCKEKVSSRYFWVELLNGALWAGITWQYLIASWEPLRAIFYAITAAALVAIIFIDWELYIIPDELNAFILFAGIVYRALDGTFMSGVYGALMGWGIIWGIQLLGRIAFRKDAMGDGDVKMMRGVGFVLGPTLTAAGIGLAVPLGLVGGIAGIIIDSLAAKKAPQVEEPPAEEEEYQPTPVWAIFYLGTIYLLCLDIVSLFSKGLRERLEKPLPQHILEEDDETWQPSATTIPFGPYLAAGVLICLLFAKPVERFLVDYWQSSTGQPVAAQQPGT